MFEPWSFETARKVDYCLLVGVVACGLLSEDPTVYYTCAAKALVIVWLFVVSTQLLVQALIKNLPGARCVRSLTPASVAVTCVAPSTAPLTPLASVAVTYVAPSIAPLIPLASVAVT